MRFKSSKEAHDFLRQMPKEKPTIHKTATIYRQFVKLGSNIGIGAGSVIGKPGFGFEKINSKWERINHIGKVLIGDNVEIGAQCVIDRAKIEATMIGAGTKLDNRIHIAHNCIIGKNCLVAAGVVMGGSVIVDDDCFVGLNATIKDHVRIGKGVTIGCGANVIGDVEAGMTVVGNPAIDIESIRLLAR